MPGTWQTFAHSPSTALTQTVTGLTNGTAYDFQVAAVDAVGAGAFDAIVTATPTSATTAPSKPVITSAVAGISSATVTWTVSNGGSPVTSSAVTIHGGSGGVQTLLGAGTSLLVTGLTPGTSYTFTVICTNVNGSSPASVASAAVVPTGGAGTVTRFGGTTVSTVAAAQVASVTYTPVTGHGLVLAIGTAGSGGQMVTSVSDGTANVWSLAAGTENSTSAALATYQCRHVVSSGQITIKVTMSNATSAIALTLVEVVGQSTTSMVDQQTLGQGTTTAVSTDPTGVPSQTNEMVIGILNVSGTAPNSITFSNALTSVFTEPLATGTTQGATAKAILGLIDRSGDPKTTLSLPATDPIMNVLGGFIPTGSTSTQDGIPWKELQPASFGPINSANSGNGVANVIDKAITAVRTQMAVPGQTRQWHIIIRILTGETSVLQPSVPAWALAQGGGPISGTDATNGTVSMGAWWTPLWLAAWEDLMTKLAALYDAVPEVGGVDIGLTSTEFTESLLKTDYKFGAAGAGNANALLTGVYQVDWSYAQEQATNEAAAAFMPTVWKQTPAFHSYNPADVLTTGTTDQVFPITLMDYVRSHVSKSLGLICNKSVRANGTAGVSGLFETIDAQGNVSDGHSTYNTLYTHILAISNSAIGGQASPSPIHLQTSSYTQMGATGGDLQNTLAYCVALGARCVELPAGYTVLTAAQLNSYNAGLAANNPVTAPGGLSTNLLVSSGTLATQATEALSTTLGVADSWCANLITLNGGSTQAVPGAPTAIAAQGAVASAVVSWLAPSFNGGAAITDYTLQYSSTGSAGPWTSFAHSPGTALTQTVTGLTNGTLYFFQVAAVNVVGTGPYDNFASATPAASPVAPTAPTWDTTDTLAGNGEIFWEWIPGDTGTQPTTQYTLTEQSSVDGGVTWTSLTPIVLTGSPPTPFFDDNTVSNGVLYLATVTATSSAGTSAASANSPSVFPSSPTPPVNPVIPIPTPAGKVIQPANLLRDLNTIEKRLQALEATAPSSYAVSDAGGQVRVVKGSLDILGGSFVGTYGIAVLNGQGTVIFSQKA